MKTSQTKQFIRERIEIVATEDNAAAYAATDEKFVFCIDLLEVSAHWGRVDYWVNQLEDRFDAINDEMIDQGYIYK
tara:strand:- start:2027 stop:2254 length:228 start_codon:yes stop_codon:yes gene_type:complete